MAIMIFNKTKFSAALCTTQKRALSVNSWLCRPCIITVLHNLLMIIMAIIGSLHGSFYSLLFLCVALDFKCLNVIEISHFLSLFLSLTQAINFVKSERGQ